MSGTVLVAVDDSPPGIAAARLAVELAATLGWRVRAIHVLDHGPVPHALGAPAAGPAATPTAPAPPATPALRYVARLAEHAGVGCETAEITGEVTESVLDQARSAGAKLIVIGRSSRHDAGHPYVGSHTRHVLEFSDIPVLVVPHSPG